MRRNEKTDLESSIRPDENYAREVMQLFSIGLYELNLDGTRKLDSEGNSLPTYTQNDILEFARIYTGWNYSDSPQFRSNTRTENSYLSAMVPFEAFHDTGSKILFQGEVLPAGQLAEKDLDDALDNIFKHPNLGPFIASRLIERLVSSNPSPAYVARTATIFNDNGSGVRGDLGALTKAILLDEEALNGYQNSPLTSGKLKEPVIRLTQLWRAFKAEGVNGYIRYTNPDMGFGQKPYSSLSVFNFYQPGFSPSGSIANAGLTAPEFQIVTDASLATTTNRLGLFAFSFDYGSTGQIQQVILNTEKEKLLAENPDELIDHLNSKLMGGGDVR